MDLTPRVAAATAIASVGFAGALRRSVTAAFGVLLLVGGLPTLAQSAPTVTNVAITSSPASGDTYELAEAIDVEVTFSRAVGRTTVPSGELMLTIGERRRTARALHGSTQTRWTFRYWVDDLARDSDGISIDAGALSGSFVSADGMAATLALGANTVSNASLHKVDGSVQSTPAIADVRLLSSPTSGDTYGLGEFVEALVVFDRLVVVEHGRGLAYPQLALTVGSQKRQARTTSIITTNSRRNLQGGYYGVSFTYRIQPSDTDTNGISVAADALSLNGGAIKIRGGANSASLDLGSNTISDSSDHKVDGSSESAPTVTGLSLNGPISGDTYGLAEEIAVWVVFDLAVDVTGSPQLVLMVGGQERRADYTGRRFSLGPVTGNRQFEERHMVFRYRVQSSDVDSDGITIAANALSLNGGTVRIADGTTNATLGLGDRALSNDSFRKVDGGQESAPRVTQIYASNLPASGIGVTYGLADEVMVVVLFDHAVDVTGSPSLALASWVTVAGSVTREASYLSGSGSRRLTFRYRVQSSDTDAFDVYALPGALSLNGGSIKLAGSTVNAVVRQAFTTAIGRRVDAGHGAIALSQWTLTVRETSSETYTVRLGKQPVGGNVTVAITGAADGIAASPTSLTFTATNWATAQTVTASSTNDQNQADEVVTLTHTASGGGYGDVTAEIEVTTLDDDAARLNVSLTQLTVEEGASGTYAIHLNTQPSGDVTVTVGGASGAVTVDTDAATGDQSTLTFTRTNWNASQTVTVSAASDSNSANETLTLSHTASGGGYGGLDSSARPGVALTVDDDAAPGFVFDANPATTSEDEPGPLLLTEDHATSASKSYTVRLAGQPTQNVTATITSADTRAVTVDDTDGESANGVQNTLSFTTENWNTAQTVTVRAVPDSDSLNESIVVSHVAATATSSEYSNVSDNFIVSVADDDVPPTVSSVTITRNPVSGDTYERAEVIEVGVTFSAPVSVSWPVPRLALGIGSQTRQATYYSGRGSRQLTFFYAVQSSDRDTDGITVASDALSGFIYRTGYLSRRAVLTLGASAIENSSLHKVDGSRASTPSVADVRIETNPRSGDTYGLAEAIGVTVWFDRAVDLTGGPQLALTMDSQMRQMKLGWRSSSGNPRLVRFFHQVESSDLDLNGVSIGASALSLNSGTIKIAGGATDATLNLGASAITNSSQHKVDGSQEAVPAVTFVFQLNFPSGTAFAKAEVIEVEVEFDLPVDVVGRPQLALTIGSQTRLASYWEGSGSGLLWFRYTVQSSDVDTDGVTVRANALSLNGGTIKIAGGATNAALGLGGVHDLYVNVDGSQETAPTVTEVAITSEPEDGDAYQLGENVFVRVTFDRAVNVTGAPRLALTIDSQTRQASYYAGTGSPSILFYYTVQSSDRDTNGISIGASALTLNSGTIKIAGGTTNATLGLGTEAITNSSGHKVNGSLETALEVTEAQIDSSPTNGDTYWLNERVVVRLTFNGSVDVTGSPQLALLIGSQTRQASYSTGTGTPWLDFAYTVQSTDRDTDGISVSASALTLNGGTIKTAGGTVNAALALGTAAIGNSSNHKVDGSLSLGILLDANPTTTNANESGPLALDELSTSSNNSKSYTVRLSHEPTQDVTVTITSNDAAVTVGDTDSIANGEQNALTFTSSSWNTPQTVTLTAAQDDNGVGESATITHVASTTSQSEYTNISATITANVTDDEVVGFVFDADPDTANDQSGPLQLNELSSSSTNSDDYTVRLSAEPTQTVTATITSGDTSSVAVADTDTDTPGDQNTLTFTSTNWNTPQTVTLAAQQDDNGYDESVTITHTAATTPNSEYTSVSGSFTASVNDDETPAITLSASTLTVPEQSNATYTVRLATEPVGGSVTVGITGAADGLAASPTSLTFTSGNWDTARTVTVAAANDDNGENETATFRHAASGADYGSAAAAEIVATSTDDDTPRLQASTTQLTVDENANATYTVRLNTQPSANVTVTVSGASGAVTVDTATTSGNQNTLTFTSSNWGTNQTVTVAAADDGNAVDEELTLSHTASGGDYASLPSGARPGVAVTVDDDDTAGIVLDADPDTPNDQSGPLALAELSTASNNSVSYTVRLSSEPTQDATVAITSNDAAVTVDDTDGDSLNGVQNTLTFTSTNWNTPQTVTLTAAQDDNGTPESATITHTSTTASSSEYANLAATITANTTDDETPGFVFDADPDTANDQSGPLQLNELSSSSTNSDDYTVRLSSEPTQTVTATITSGNASSVTVDDTDGIAQGTQNTLTFTSSNWNTPQTVTLSAQQDDNGYDESVTITHTAATTPNSEYTNVNGSFTASVNDDETPAITLSTATLTVQEQNSADYTVRLATEPVGGSVTVAITGAADGLSTNLTSLTFTTGNWNTVRTVRVTAANDDNGESETATFRHTASGADYGSASAAELEATSTDNDTPGLQVSTMQLTVNENANATYTIRLNTEPSANVTVTVSGASGAVTVDTATTNGNQNTLTFTSTNWATAQTVTVAAADDGNAVNETPTLAHTASGGDYASLPSGARPSVQLTVDDDDTAGILLDADPGTPNDQSGPLALNELPSASNNSVDYTVRLSSEPTQDATVTITSNDAAVTVGDTDGDSLNGVQNTLTFTSTNWNTPQTVTLTAADDNDGTGESATITHTSATASASEYSNLAASITANTTDDDAPAFVFDADPDTANDQSGPLQLNELSSSSANSDDYTVRLSSEPTQTVTATITSGNTAAVTVDDTDGIAQGTQNTLTFTATNWNTPQTVTLTAQQDDNGYDESVTITHAAATTTNSEYRNVSGNFTASVSDDETPAIALSTTTLTVPEQDSATYTVQLATEPVGGSVTVDITGAADRLSASPTRLIFTTGNWDTARTVRITAANDQNGENEMVTFSHAASGADYGSVTAAELVATSTDNDTPRLQVTPTTLEVDENSSGTYRVRLNTQPTASVTVTVSGASGAVTVDTATTSGDQNTLTFTTTTWSAQQTVTVAAGDDGNATNEMLTLTHTASGGGYGSLGTGARPSVQLEVDDDDTAGILVDADPNTANDQAGPVLLNELSTATNNTHDYTVRLSSEPTQDATVTITSNLASVTVGDTDGDSLNGVQNTLTFTAANWNTPRTVTLTAAEDDNGVGESATITHTSSTSSASEYTNLAATLTANTTDDDTPSFVFDADPDTANDQSGPLALNELSSSATNSDDYTVRLHTQPVQTVTATITSNTPSVTVDDTDGDSLNGVQNTLTFTATNWATPQTVTLTAQQDDNGFDETATITHRARTTPNSEYTNVNGNFTASVNDDEAPAITLSTTTLTVPEQNSATYTVRLATEPVGGNVTVDVTGAADGLSASPTRLVFTTGNWDTERTVRITAANDQDGDSEVVTFSHAASGADYGSVPAAALVATSTDDDTPRLQVTPTTLEVDENSSGTYRVRLNTQPTGNVTVTVSGATGAVTVDTSTTTGNQNTLTFSTTTWSAYQTVTVAAGDDGNAQNEMLTLSHTASGGGYGALGAGARPSVQLTVDDNDTAGILLDADPNTPNDQAGPIALAELSTASNNSVSYTVRLASEPTQTATVTITSNDATAVTVDDTDTGNPGVQNTLTFTNTNWNTPQTVTLTAAQDNDGVGENVTITHTAATASASEYTNLQATITANTTDAQAPGFVFDADPSSPATDESGPLQLNELSSSATNSADYTVRLTSQPTQTVTATITSGNTSAVTVGDTDGIAQGVQNTLTFTATNWNTPQTVTLSAQQDDNGFDESVTIAHAAATTTNSEYRNVGGNFTATVNDDETPAIALSTTTLTVPEENSATYTVQLATEPVGGNVTVDITGAADRLSASPTRLVFMTGSWDTARTVRITAANDQDGNNEMVTFRHAASGADYGGVPAANLVATSTDNDTPSLSVTPTTLEVDENSSGAYRVRLNTQPTANVTVTVSGATGVVTVDTSTTSGDQNTLTFTTTTWSAYQTVAVSAGDDGNAQNEMLTLAHAASGGDYGALGAGALPSVQLTVADDDTAGILIDADPNTPNDQSGPLALNELSTASNNSANYTVRLSSEPTQDTTVTITSNEAAVTVGDTDGDSLNGVQNTLTFTSTNWNTPRTVTLTAAEDDDGVGESATITHTSTTTTQSEYTNLSATLTANTTDDDAPSFVFDADPDTANDQSGPLALDELSTSLTNSDDYTVRLYTQPTRAVTATITSNTPSVTVDDTDGDSLNGVQNTLTFTSSNWNTPQTVTLTAQQDDNGFDETATLTHRARTTPNSEYTNVDGTFTASVTDDETPAIVLSASTLTVPEENSATYTVQLATQPVGGNATVDITGAADGITPNPTRLVFTARNWNTARQVRVSAANDNDSTNEVVTLTHAASGADYGGVPTAAIVVTATDDDTPSLNVSPTRLPVRENGSASYTLRLNTQPSAPVTVTVGGTTAEVTVDADPDAAGDQTAMTFDATNWNANRTVTVSAADDDDATDETVNLTHAATGGDYTGLALASRPGVEVPVDDDDTPALLIDADPDTAGDQPGPLALNELSSHVDNTKNYTVRLATRPTAQVEVAVSSGDRAVHVDTGAAPRMRTLTFTTTNWATAQTVEAVAAVDADASDERVSISHAATGGDYEDVSAQLLATTLDDDEPAIVVAASALVGSGVAEGGEATYTVRLDTEPDGAARVSVSAEGAVSVDLDRNQAGAQPWLRFDATNWNTPRTALVLGLEDADAASGTATLRHAASGADYGRAAAVDVSFAVTDDDAPEVRSDATSVEANEGSTAAYSVTLATAPTGGTVEVAPTSSDEAVATVSPTTLRFTASNWYAPQRVTVRGVSDGAANITHPTTGADYGSAPTPTVAATVRDDDAPGVRIEPTLLRMEEGASAGYRVRLNTEPAAEVTVTATSGSSELTLQDGAQQVGTLALTFTTQNWNAEQQVRAQSVVDDDVADETTTVTHAVAGYAGVSSAPTLAVEVEDDDAPGIAFEPAEGLSLTEGGAATGMYSAVLTARPSATVTVAVSGDDVGLAFDTSADPGDQTELTFTAMNWNVAQTVTARAETDADAATEEAVLLHAASGGGYDGVTAKYDVRISDAEAAPAPARVQVSSAGTTSLAVSWSASPGARGYWVQWRPAGGEWSLDRVVEVSGGGSAGGGTLRVATGALSARIDGLREGVVYEVRVLGLNRGDPGDPSTLASAMPRASSAGGNRAPEAVATPEIVLLEVGGQTELDLSGMFREPDGDALTYSAASTNPEVASATVAGATLRIFGGRPGNAEIAVTAEDPQGLSARLDVRVGVIGTACSTAPAQAPEGGTAVVTAELAAAVEGSTTVRWRIMRDTDPATPDADADDHGGASGEVEIRSGERCAEIEIPILNDTDAEPAREWFEVELRLRYNRDARLAKTTVPVAVLEGVCDRAPPVRRALMAATGANACAEPAPADLRLVRTLDLSGTGLAALATEDLGGLSALRTLDLSGNGLSGLPALPMATRLEHLLLAANALEAVPLDALPAPERLRSLSLSDNALAELPADAFAAVPGLRSLRLDGNRLQALPNGLFANLGSLRMLRLDGNPGAPFRLPVHLERIDAEPWAAAPATLRAAMPLGAPFETVIALTAEGGTFADGATESETTVLAGKMASEPFAVDSETGFARVSLTAPELPVRQCLSGPCWQGFALEAGEPLALFARPLQVLAVPEPAPLFGDGLRVALSSLAEAGEPEGELRWSVRSSDPTVATAHILDGALLVEPEPGAEGVVQIEATATDAHGQMATVRFEVQVEFHWPTSPTRGWRGVILNDQR